VCAIFKLFNIAVNIMRPIVPLTIIAVSFAAATNLKFSATTTADIPASSIWIFSTAAVTENDIASLCSPEVTMVLDYPRTLADAKMSTIISDFTGFGNTDTIYIPPQYSTLESFVITVVKENIAINTEVSVTIRGICADFSPLGSYTYMITTANGEELIGPQFANISNPDAIENPDASESQASGIIALVSALLITLLVEYNIL
jgi:hypothetical protein